MLIKKELKSHQDAKVSYICGKRFLKKLAKSKNYRNVRDHCHYTYKYRGATHNICILRFNVPNEIQVVFHSGSNYDYHFIIKELSNDFEGQFECLEELQKSTITFLVPIEKEATKIDKDGNESVVTISYKIKFIDGLTFIASSLSSLVDNLTEEIHKIKCKHCDCFLGESVKGNLLKYKCTSWNKDYSNKIDEELEKQFKNAFKFSNNDINKFILLLRKGLYPYKYNE